MGCPIFAMREMRLAFVMSGFWGATNKSLEGQNLDPTSTTDVFTGGAYCQLLTQGVGLGTKRRLPAGTEGSEMRQPVSARLETSVQTGTGHLTPAPVDPGCSFGLVGPPPQPHCWRLKEREKEQQALWSWCCCWDQSRRPWRISPKVPETTFVQLCQFERKEREIF